MDKNNADQEPEVAETKKDAKDNDTANRKLKKATVESDVKAVEQEQKTTRDQKPEEQKEKNLPEVDESHTEEPKKETSPKSDEKKEESK